jgi:hypothetical protein
LVAEGSPTNLAGVAKLLALIEEARLHEAVHRMVLHGLHPEEVDAVVWAKVAPAPRNSVSAAAHALRMVRLFMFSPPGCWRPAFCGAVNLAAEAG